MTTRNWRPLLNLKLAGGRYQDVDEGLDLRDLDELVLVRKLLVELAKDQWYADNPMRERLSAKQEAQLEIRFVRTEPGSTVVPLRWPAPPTPPGVLFADVIPDPLDLVAKLPKAALRLHEAFVTIRESNALPLDFPRESLGDLESLGSSLLADETATLEIPRQPTPPALPVPLDGKGQIVLPEEPPPPVVIDLALREAVSKAVSTAMKVEGIFTGEVTMASLRGKASLRTEEHAREIPIDYPAARASEMTDALHRHNEVRVRIRGNGVIDSKTGIPKKLVVDDFAVLPIPDPNAPSRDAFARWATSEPGRLMAVLSEAKLSPPLLTFAAEIAGEAWTAALVAPVLLQLLLHPSPLVREGAVYGLAKHIGFKGVEEYLREIAQRDPSKAVREAASDILEAL